MKKVIIAIVIILIGVGIMRTLTALKPEAEKVTREKVLPSVEALVVRAADEETAIETQGLVEPKTVTNIASEVSGRVISVSPKFETGETFDEGEILIEIDPSDYTASLAQSEASLADAQLALAQEKARGLQADRDWKKLGGGDEATDLVLRKPQLASATARVAAAAAVVEKGERDLERTRVRAPYKARIRATYTDLGSFVAPGAPIADVYATEPYEVRLPLSIDDAAQANLSVGAEVPLSATIGRSELKWMGKIVRREGEVDRASRSVYVVAEITPSPDGPQVEPGSFVNASVPGQVLTQAFRIPRRAFLDEERLLVIDAENKLEFRAVTVARFEGTDALVVSGLTDGERICNTSLSAPVSGMEVNVVAPQ